jgi:hypothetical protein
MTLSSLYDGEHADILLSNVNLVFDEVAQQHTIECSKHGRSSLTVQNAMTRLHAVEQSKNQLVQMSGKRAGASTAHGLQVNNVNAGTSENQKHKQRFNAKAEEIRKRKSKYKCANCNKTGHWYAECTVKP